MDYLTHIIRSTIDLVFPARCIVCRAFDTTPQPTYLCKRCLSIVPIKRLYECVGCKIPTPYGLTCHFCRPDWALDQLCIAAPYDDKMVKAVIHAFKYRFISTLSKPLAELVRKYIRDRTRHGLSLFAANPIIIPVPLTVRRLNWRGFNQAELLAQHLAATYQMELRTDIVSRIGSAPQQVRTIGRQERLENIKGIFACTKPNILCERDVLLVDDVCTTGATLNECARVLKDAGARSVAALVVARGT